MTPSSRCYSGGGPGKADHWQINDWTLQRHTAATSPEMSVAPSNTSNTTYDDFSGEVAHNGNGHLDQDEIERLAWLATVIDTEAEQVA